MSNRIQAMTKLWPVEIEDDLGHEYPALTDHGHGQEPDVNGLWVTAETRDAIIIARLREGEDVNNNHGLLNPPDEAGLVEVTTTPELRLVFPDSLYGEAF